MGITACGYERGEAHPPRECRWGLPDPARRAAVPIPHAGQLSRGSPRASLRGSPRVLPRAARRFLSRSLPQLSGLLASGATTDWSSLKAARHSSAVLGLPDRGSCSLGVQRRSPSTLRHAEQRRVCAVPNSAASRRGLGRTRLVGRCDVGQKNPQSF